MAILRDVVAGQEHDVAALQDLLESAADYTLRVSGQRPTHTAGRDALEALPPGLNRSNKTCLGLWTDDAHQLIGFADVLFDWPEPGTAHIGLLLIHSDVRGTGVGRQLHHAVVTRALERGNIGELRLKIVETNAPDAEPFWHALGYRATGESAPYTAGTVRSSAAVWSRPLEV